MPRRSPGAAVAVAVALATMLLGFTGTPDGAGATSPGPVATTSAPVPGPDPVPAVARTPYERRHLEARRDSVDLEAVVGDRDRPNILVLMTDDMREDDLRFMPHTRRLVGDAGVHFTSSFSPHPLCCPARATFITGQYSHNHEVWSHVDPYGFRVLDDRQTLPVWLREAGYRTTFLGKYLNGYGGDPLLDGSPSVHYVPPGWSDWRGSVDKVDVDPEDPLSGGTYRYFDTTLNVNGRLEPHEGIYQTHLYSRITQDVVRTAARSPRPFFAYISFTAPHVGAPIEPDDTRPVRRADGRRQAMLSPARPDYVKGRFDQLLRRIPGGEDPRDRIADKPFFIRGLPPISGVEEAALMSNYRQRAEALSVVDDEVANIFATLERTGELDNTYVMFTSDNGFFLGEHRRRQGKTLPYEPSLRVPMLLRGPGIPAGAVRTDPFLTTDVAPTLLDAAGAAPPPGLDGVSMLDVARTGDRGWVRGVQTETGPRRAERPGTTVTNPLEFRGRDYEIRFSQGVRTGRWLYVEHASGEQELYDLRGDPRQFVNLAGRLGVRAVQRLLARELDRLRDCAGAECNAPLPEALRTDDPAPAWVPSTMAGDPLTLTR